MNGSRYNRWLAAFFVCGITALQAQEPAIAPGPGREIPIPDAYIPQEIAMPEMIPFTRWNLPGKNKPPRWEQLLNEKVARERAWEQSVLLNGWADPTTKRITVQGNNAVLGQFRIGNHPAAWSISAGAHLDARTLHFPLPRHMTPGKQPAGSRVAPPGSRVAPNGQIKR